MLNTTRKILWIATFICAAYGTTGLIYQFAAFINRPQIINFDLAIEILLTAIVLTWGLLFAKRYIKPGEIFKPKFANAVTGICILGIIITSVLLGAYIQGYFWLLVEPGVNPFPAQCMGAVIAALLLLSIRQLTTPTPTAPSPHK